MDNVRLIPRSPSDGSDCDYEEANSLSSDDSAQQPPLEQQSAPIKNPSSPSSTAKLASSERELTRSSRKSRFVDSINQVDVLLGRGKRNQNWHGNELFRQHVSVRSKEYIAPSTSKTLRDEIAKEVIDKVYQSGGRFLQELRGKAKSSDGLAEQTWVLASHPTIRTKTKQALRDLQKKNKETPTIAVSDNQESQHGRGATHDIGMSLFSQYDPSSSLRHHQSRSTTTTTTSSGLQRPFDFSQLLNLGGGAMTQSPATANPSIFQPTNLGTSEDPQTLLQTQEHLRRLCSMILASGTPASSFVFPYQGMQSSLQQYQHPNHHLNNTTTPLQSLFAGGGLSGGSVSQTQNNVMSDNEARQRLALLNNMAVNQRLSQQQEQQDSQRSLEQRGSYSMLAGIQQQHDSISMPHDSLSSSAAEEDNTATQLLLLRLLLQQRDGQPPPQSDKTG